MAGKDVKVNSLGFIHSYISKVRLKQEEHSSDQGHPQHHPSEQDQSNSEQNSDSQLEELHQALSEFQNDQQAQAHGIQASQLNTDSGIKIVLKDSSGVVIRQLSGDDFIKLRQSNTQEPRVRGKILDQKL